MQLCRRRLRKAVIVSWWRRKICQPWLARAGVRRWRQLTAASSSAAFASFGRSDGWLQKWRRSYHRKYQLAAAHLCHGWPFGLYRLTLRMWLSIIAVGLFRRRLAEKRHQLAVAYRRIGGGETQYVAKAAKHRRWPAAACRKLMA
jgi:hypothetical protein